MTLIVRAVKRETAATIRDGGKFRPIIVELRSGYMVLRAKGTRRGYELPYGSAYLHAVRLAVEEQRREKIKKGRKGVRL